ncbi:hypothetical protein [Ureaplasma ceti]|uniref:DUF31 domain-containing protein n=1 Tax=Ureaplasma ceti TaxID=3119530 RepID=A0ABP9U4N5_9BACT
MKTNFKKNKYFLISLGLLAIAGGLTWGLTSCSSTVKPLNHNLINQNTKNSTTKLINNLSLSLKATTAVNNIFATGFVFDENVVKNPKNSLRTFYIMTNYHFFHDIQTSDSNYLINTSLSLASEPIGGTVSAWNYDVSNFNFHIYSKKEPKGDIYLLNDYALETNYDVAVLKVQVNLKDHNLPHQFAYFDEHKQELKYNNPYLGAQQTTTPTVTIGGYPYDGHTGHADYEQFSNKPMSQVVFMDPLLSNYPELNGYSFNNEIIAGVKNMALKPGASGSLVLGPQNGLLGIYFGLMQLKNQAPYGLFIPFDVTETYYEATFNYLGQQCYFKIVNLNNSNNPQVQSSAWIKNPLYTKNNYNNLIDAQLINGGIKQNLTKKEITEILQKNPQLKLSLTVNTPLNGKSTIVKEDISIKSVLEQAKNLTIKQVVNHQDIFGAWIREHGSSVTFLSSKN